MNEKEIIRLYVKELWTLRRIADEFDSNHHMIRRILQRNNIELTKTQVRAPMSEKQKKAISARNKGRSCWSKGKVLPESFRRANMKGRSGTSIDLDAYPDYERLLFLMQRVSSRKSDLAPSDEKRKEFLDRFYFDEVFNAIYDAWVAHDKCKWWYPSLDHKTSKFAGGGWEIENLQFLTWFENRAKAEMSAEEWLEFKRTTDTKSQLFVEEILNEYRTKRG